MVNYLWKVDVMKELSLFLCVLVFMACSKAKDTDSLPDIPEEEATLSVTPSRFTFSSDGGLDSLTIISNYRWTISHEDEWCRPSVREGQGNFEVQIIAEANSLINDRETRWIINAGKFHSDTIYISQNFKDANLNFPDDQFQKYLLKNFDKNHDGYLSVSEAHEVISIYIQADNLNLEGLDYFPELKFLSCYPNDNNSSFGMKKLDISQNKYLTTVFCYYNQLTELDISNNTGLEMLHCHGNKIQSLDASGLKDLKTLYCSDNQMNILVVANCGSLDMLYCNDNQLEELDITTCSFLKHLNCNNNKLTSLNLEKSVSLQTLSCQNNQLTSLNVNNCSKLTNLNCSDNPIQSLEIMNCPLLGSLLFPEQLSRLSIKNNEALDRIISLTPDYQIENIELENCSKLISFIWSGKRLAQLLVISCPMLKELRFASGKLSSLHVKDCAGLEELSCDNNQLMDLNISNCNSLKELLCNNNQLTNLDICGFSSLVNLYCDNNQLIDLDVSNCTSLKELWCSDNQLVELKLEDCISLEKLDCSNNQLMILDVTTCTSLWELNCRYGNSNLKTIYKKKGQYIKISAPAGVEIIEK